MILLEEVNFLCVLCFIFYVETVNFGVPDQLRMKYDSERSTVQWSSSEFMVG